MTKNARKKELDKLDCRLIRLLQKDGRMSNIALAQELGVSEYTVRSRLKRLLDDETIKIVAVFSVITLVFGISGNETTLFCITYFTHYTILISGRWPVNKIRIR